MEEGDTAVEDGANHHAQGEDICQGRHCVMQLNFWCNVVQVWLQVSPTFRVETHEASLVLTKEGGILSITQ